MTIEIICVILGLAQGVLAYLNKRSNWIVYAAQMAFLAIFSVQNELWGDMVQNVFYLAVCIYSYFYLWSETGGFERISVLTNKSRVIWVLAILIGTLFVGLFLKSTTDPLPFVDAFTTVTTFVALILMSYHKIEAWIVWFVNDVGYIYEYYAIPNQALYLLGLYVVWTVLAVLTFINWVKLYEKQNGQRGILGQSYKPL